MEKNRNLPDGLEFVKLQPQAVEFEEVLLGSIILEADTIERVSDLICQEAFYRDANKKIYGAIINLHIRNERIDILTVVEELRINKQLEDVGGPMYISKITSQVATSLNAESHAMIIQQKYILRELIRIGSELQRNAFDDGSDPADLISDAESKLLDLGIKETSDPIIISSIIKTSIEKIEEIGKKKSKVAGYSTGITSVDKMLNGLEPGDFIIIAGRPSMGKTAFSLQILRNISKLEIPVALFSLEMDKLQIGIRIIAGESNVNSNDLRTGNVNVLDWKKIEDSIIDITKSNLFIDDTSSIKVQSLRSKVKKLINKNKIKGIVIDYLQLMRPGIKLGSRELEISYISQSLKSIAKDFGIFVVAVSQLSRSVELRGGEKKPLLSDLRESGTLEQDADKVMFVYRPEYYGITETADGENTAGLAEIITAKNRNGSVGSVWLSVDPTKVNWFERNDFCNPVIDNPEF